ncbi:hypothetical protein CVT26_006385 [Gymnopilus dilepis]|uniref:Uncharacterized protein n=1 Tax=Gymnopilus dilepis TaxID=231916 RepID=A0A409Y0J0_9AGAR|nr:hypothetical protein CVT26_006385 [Gymnopilus dilepis]
MPWGYFCMKWWNLEIHNYTLNSQASSSESTRTPKPLLLNVSLTLEPKFVHREIADGEEVQGNYIVSCEASGATCTRELWDTGDCLCGNEPRDEVLVSLGSIDPAAMVAAILFNSTLAPA